MKKALGVVVGLSLIGLVGLGQGCCPPPSEPPCYTSFWVGEAICFELVTPYSLFCCCCCGDSPVQVTGWRVVTLEGNVVYQEAFAAPMSPGEWSWKQVDLLGNPVAPNFYKIVVSTTSGEYETVIRIMAKPECGCCFFGRFGLWSRPCGISWCEPYVKVYRCPACCPAPCGCGISIFLGSGG